jgi:ferrochelatase
METPGEYDAFLLVSFGGPEGKDDVMPFLRNVTRGRNIPDSRLEAVAHRYYMFGGVSPINDLNRALLADLKDEFEDSGISLPIYWGNRNWHPMLEDTVARMRDDGITRAIALATSAYSSYSSCRQYLDDIERARQAVGPGAPVIDKIPPFYSHPYFIEANEEHLRDAIFRFPAEQRRSVHVAFTAHSIPQTMAGGCDYAVQLEETARLLASRVDCLDFAMVYQSRSGPPQQPWLEPDICDHIRTLHGQDKKLIVIAPIGFVSDHMEILYDLDTEAKALCEELGVTMHRASTAGAHPIFIEMIRELVEDHQSALADNGDQSADAANRLCREQCCPRQVS